MTVSLMHDRSREVNHFYHVLAVAALLSTALFQAASAYASDKTASAANYCAAIPIAHPGTAVPAPFTGSTDDWKTVAQAIAKSDWQTARSAFEHGSTFRGALFTGAREPADTFYRRGFYKYTFQAMYQLAFCGDTSTLTYAESQAAPAYKAALIDAMIGRYASAKTEIASDIVAHPTFDLGRNMQAVLSAITHDRSAAIAGWQQVAAHGLPTAMGQPSIESIDAAEYLLFTDSKILAESAKDALSSVTAPASPRGIATSPAFARFASPGPTTVPSAVPAFDVVDSWSDAPLQSSYQQLKYVHVRIYLHPAAEVKVRSHYFRIDGDVDGRTQTYTGLIGSAPYVQKSSYVYSTGRVQSTIVPAVAAPEDLGRAQTLDLEGGEAKTVVVTFAVPANAQFSDSQLHSVRFVYTQP